MNESSLLRSRSRHVMKSSYVRCSHISQRGLGLRGTRLRFVHGLKPGYDLFHGLRKFFRMADNVQEKTSHVEGRPGKFATVRGEWWAAQAAGLRNMVGQVNRIHTAARQRLVLILRQPYA